MPSVEEGLRSEGAVVRSASAEGRSYERKNGHEGKT